MKYTFTFTPAQVSYQGAATDATADLATLCAQNDEVVIVADMPNRCRDAAGLVEPPCKMVLERHAPSTTTTNADMTYNGTVIESTGPWLVVSSGGLLIIAGLQEEKKWWLQDGDHVRFHLGK